MASPDLDIRVAGTGWVVTSKQYDLGSFRLRLTQDRQTLILVHSTDIHLFPPQIEEATLIHLDHLTEIALTAILGELLRTRRPNLTHPS